MKLLDGKQTANKLNNQLKEKVALLEKKPRLEIILVGDDSASSVYVKNKIKTGQEIGFIVNVTKISSDTTYDHLSLLIADLNNNDEVDGILLQLPRPNHLDEKLLIDQIHPDKDVDGFHTLNQGKLFKKLDGIKPATPLGIMMLLGEYNIEVSGKHAVVIGRSQIVGLPIAKMLLDNNATVSIVHSKTKNIKEITKQADILIVAIGKPNFVDNSFIKNGVVVVDVGINRINNKLVGDVDFENIKDHTSYITPVPGGVGPMTICALGFNILTAHHKVKTNYLEK